MIKHGTKRIWNNVINEKPSQRSVFISRTVYVAYSLALGRTFLQVIWPLRPCRIFPPPFSRDTDNRVINLHTVTQITSHPTLSIKETVLTRFTADAPKNVLQTRNFTLPIVLVFSSVIINCSNSAAAKTTSIVLGIL